MELLVFEEEAGPGPGFQEEEEEARIPADKETGFQTKEPVKGISEFQAGGGGKSCGEAVFTGEGSAEAEAFGGIEVEAGSQAEREGARRCFLCGEAGSA
ncbi:MAG: hypothetical protein LBK27_07465 [Treponema sp.]|nr:hypothetical protein [Treponema sp.]